jgi:hypothetical protein
VLALGALVELARVRQREAAQLGQVAQRDLAPRREEVGELA